MDLSRAVGSRVKRFQLVFLAVKIAVEEVKQYQQNHAADQYGRQHMFYRPHKVHALQETEEQRRIAQGREAAADVGHQKDEENHYMYSVLAVIVSTQKRAD